VIRDRVSTTRFCYETDSDIESVHCALSRIRLLVGRELLRRWKVIAPSAYFAGSERQPDLSVDSPRRLRGNTRTFRFHS
jgi:hypothetical protein